MFPQVTAMAATGNLSLVNQMTAHMATEARAVNNYMKGNADKSKGGGLNYWGPTMNVRTRAMHDVHDARPYPLDAGVFYT